MAQTNTIKKMAAILQDGKVTDEEATEAFQIVTSLSKKTEIGKQDRFVKEVNRQLAKMKSNTRLTSLIFTQGSPLKTPAIFRDSEPQVPEGQTCMQINISRDESASIGCIESLRFYFNAEGSFVKSTMATLLTAFEL